jgi:hypothetical protein
MIVCLPTGGDNEERHAPVLNCNRIATRSDFRIVVFAALQTRHSEHQ